MSDGVVHGTREDRSGVALVERLTAEGYSVVDHRVVEDGTESVAAALTELADGFAGVIVSTGGTGFTPRDLTPEGTKAVVEREAPGLAEAMRLVSPLGRLSRGIAGIRGQAVILNTPGLAQGLRGAAGGGARRPAPRPPPAGRDADRPLRPGPPRLRIGAPRQHPGPLPAGREPRAADEALAPRLAARAPPRAAQGLAGAGHPGAVRGRRPRRHPFVERRLQGHDRRPPRQRGPDPPPAGDPLLRRRGAVRPGGDGPGLGGGDGQPGRQPRRAALLQGDGQPGAGRGRRRRGLPGGEGGGPAPGPAGVDRVPPADRPLLRRPGDRGRRPPVVRRQRGQDPRHRRLHRRHHGDRAGRCGQPGCGSSTRSSSATPRSWPTPSPSPTRPAATPWGS